MPDYVYALHDFLPENEDEVSFRAGDRIEVVEKDDMYGDGWWQGRNLEGKVGLFPKSYTAPAAPSTEVPAPQSTPSAAENSSAPIREPEITTIASPQPKQPSATFLSGHHDDEGDMEGPDSGDLQGSGDEVMKATMTDVQRAIEQLGRGGADGEGSFTFASSHGGDTETDETDFEMSDTERANDVNGAQDWHKGARTKLAEKARRAVEEAEKLEAMMTGSGSGRTVSALPIQAELSEESEDEEDPSDRMDLTSRSSKFQRENPYILEEDEEVENNDEASKAGHAQDLSMDAATTITHLSSDTGDPLPEKDELEAQTATKASFPVFQSPPPSNLPPPETTLLDEKIPSPARSSLPSPISPNTVVSEQFAITPTPFSAPDKQKLSSIPTAREVPLSGLPSPAATSLSKHNSVMSSFSNAPSLAPAFQPVDKEVGKKDPSEWTVEEVVEWLKSKGFDQAICDKFIEQEITGDVLLELDVNLLKTEIGVMAFGKRMRIANAITDLRRPPSIVYSDHPMTEMTSPSSPMYNNTSTPPRVHSRTQSQSHSHHSFPGTLGHNYSQSVQSSLGSPIGYGAPQFSFGGQGQGHFEPVAEGGSDIYSQNGKGNNGLEIPPVADEGVTVGLGTALTSEDVQGKGTKGRPSQLTLSPSDGALKEKIILQPEQNEDEDRGHMSEGEVVPSQTMRRRLFGRSHDSTTSAGHSSSKHSNGTSSPSAPTFSHEDKDTTSLTNGSLRQARARKSIDGGKPSAGDRLSLFVVPFGGKSRKPPPSAGEHEHHAERSSMFGLPKGMRKSSSTQSQRPSTPTGSPKDKLKEPQSPFKDHEKGRKEEEGNEKGAAAIDRSTLRKRVVASVQQSNGSSSVDGKNLIGVGGVTQGQSILVQIGEPDHVGWMRKKSDRYNSWKPRYFVLKGQHLYWLKSSSVSETRLKGYIDIVGYKVTVDENLDPGRYGFRIDHDKDKTHFFSSDEKSIIREWMKAIMKATIDRDFTKPVISSCNIPTIPLVVAQAMNPAPRPPSPTARDATQRALRRENPNQLSSRDARVLMGLSSDMGSGQTRLDSFFAEHTAIENDETVPKSPKSAPPRPSREMRRANSVRSALSQADNNLVEWANSHLSASLQVEDPTVSFFGGLALLRLAESIKGRPSSPPVPDSAFPVGPTDDKLDGLFRLFDFLLDNDVKMGSVSINDIRQGKRDKILQLLKALKSWDDKRRALAQTMNGTLNPSGGGAFLMPTGMQWANLHAS